MILTLVIKCLTGEAVTPWEIKVEVEESFTLAALHLFIQQEVAFDNDHMFEFYIAKSCFSQNRKCYPSNGKAVVDNTLADLFPLEKNHKLFYLFDYGDNWLFQISKTRNKTKPSQAGIIYPRVIELKGQVPEQYPDYDDELDYDVNTMPEIVVLSSSNG